MGKGGSRRPGVGARAWCWEEECAPPSPAQPSPFHTNDVFSSNQTVFPSEASARPQHPSAGLPLSFPELLQRAVPAPPAPGTSASSWPLAGITGLSVHSLTRAHRCTRVWVYVQTWRVWVCMRVGVYLGVCGGHAYVHALSVHGRVSARARGSCTCVSKHTGKNLHVQNKS